MVVTIIIWIYVAFLSFLIGFLFVRTANRIFKATIPFEFLLSVLCGLIVINVIISYCSLYSIISLGTNLILFIGSILILLFFFSEIKQIMASALKTISFTNWQIYVGLMIFILILLQAAKEPFVSDSGLYHIQTVKWIESFAVTKGLGNLHGRLAFNSHFHLLIALFSFENWTGGVYNVTPSFVILIGILFLFRETIINQNHQTFFFSFGAILLLFIYYRDWVSSPSPDAIATIYILVGVVLALRILDQQEFSSLPLLLLVIGYAVVIKLSAIPVLLLAALVFWGKSPWQYQAKLAIILVVLFLPWFIRNYYLSGYLIYPFPAIDLFDVPWKIPYELAWREKEWISSFAKLGSYDHELVNQLKFTEWFPHWFSKRIWVNKIIFIVLATSPVVVAIKCLIDKSVKDPWKFMWLWSFSGVLFWFLLGPYFRFGHGFIITCFLTVFMVIFPHSQLKLLRYGVLFLTVIFLIHSLRVEFSEVKDFRKMLVSPEQHQTTEAEIIYLDKAMIRKPGDGHCWELPIPCTPEVIEGLHLTTQGNIKDGFYIENKTSIAPR